MLIFFIFRLGTLQKENLNGNPEKNAFGLIMLVTRPLP